ncbi:fluoride efflux transporter FluC [Tomitella fengzijianii]|uniref:fluoride efflux transporter FluC n=1 Tax=Tomitella fengzijianii TaxID=2597660 RepID=UPI001E35CA58|nr:CrcB family protein [Tomitella fengzijianii]
MSAPLHRRATLAALVAVGGVVGTLARHGLGLLFPDDPGQWPVTTFAVNIAGAFLLGMLLEALTRFGRGAPGGSGTGRSTLVRLGVGTGMLGAFTTYSTLALDTDLLLHRGAAGAAVSYALATVLVGAVTCALGIAVGARLGPRVAGRPERDGS